MRAMRFLLAVAVVGVMGLGTARADLAGSGDPFEIWFDENGNGRYSLNGGPITPASSFYLPDPTFGVAGNVLMYALPENVTSGDVRVWEDSAGTILSDVMRFVDLPDATGALSSYMIY